AAREGEKHRPLEIAGEVTKRNALARNVNDLRSGDPAQCGRAHEVADACRAAKAVRTPQARREREEPPRALPHYADVVRSSEARIDKPRRAGRDVVGRIRPVPERALSSTVGITVA